MRFSSFISQWNTRCGTSSFPLRPWTTSGGGEGERGERAREREKMEEGRRVEQACRWSASTLEGICNLQMFPEQLVRCQPGEAWLLGTHRDPPT